MSDSEPPLYNTSMSPGSTGHNSPSTSCITAETLCTTQKSKRGLNHAPHRHRAGSAHTAYASCGKVDRYACSVSRKSFPSFRAACSRLVVWNRVCCTDLAGWAMLGDVRVGSSKGLAWRLADISSNGMEMMEHLKAIVCYLL